MISSEQGKAAEIEKNAEIRKRGEKKGPLKRGRTKNSDF